MKYSLVYLTIRNLQEIFKKSDKLLNTNKTEFDFKSDVIIIKTGTDYLDILSNDVRMLDGIFYDNLSRYYDYSIRCFLIEKSEIEKVIEYNDFKKRYS